MERLPVTMYVLMPRRAFFPNTAPFALIPFKSLTVPRGALSECHRVQHLHRQELDCLSYHAREGARDFSVSSGASHQQVC
jgi:hypothetical protein